MKKFLLCIITSLAVLSGCATIMGRDKPYPATITSTPDATHFTITNRADLTIANDTTPQVVHLKAFADPYRGETYTIAFNKIGYNPTNILLDSTVNGWHVAGNFVFDGLIGWLIVDPMTGAMFSLPDNANTTLQSTTSSSDAQGLKIISIEQLTAEQHSQLQPLASR